MSAVSNRKFLYFKLYINNLSKAVYTDDIFITTERPTFVYWNGNTKNTPFKSGLTSCTEGFAFSYGAWAGYMTVVCFVKNDSTMWIWSKSRNAWVEYAAKSDLENVENKCNEDIELVVTKNSANINGGTIWGKRTGKTASIGFIDFIVETKVNMVQWTRYPLCTVDCNMTAAHSVLVNQENGTCYALEIDSGDKTIYIKVENTALTAGTWLRGQIVFMCWKDNAI